MKLVRRGGVAWAVATLVVLAACGSGAGDSLSQPPQDAALPVREVSARWATGLASDLPTMAAAADAVFVGQVQGEEGQRTGSLRPNAPATETGRSTLPVTAYGVAIERVIAGDVTAGDVVTLEQAGGVVTESVGGPVRVMLDGDEPLRAGRRYLFFASRTPGGAFTDAPFVRFSADEGTLTPPPNWDHLPLVRELSGLAIDEVASRVAATGGSPVAR